MVLGNWIEPGTSTDGVKWPPALWFGTACKIVSSTSLQRLRSAKIIVVRGTDNVINEISYQLSDCFNDVNTVHVTF